MGLKINIVVNLLNYYSAPTGGEEQLIKNLIEGFELFKPAYMEFFYLITEPAFPKFEEHLKNKKVEIIDVKHDRISIRLIWQIIKLKKIIPDSADILFNPQFILPRNLSGIKTVSVFHDSQYRDIPENFSFLERCYYNYINYKTVRNSDYIVTISQFSKNKINKYYNFNKTLKVIHNPIKIDTNIKKSEEKMILKKYDLEKNKYYYTISTNYKHKNIITLVDLFSKKMDGKYVITGSKREITELFEKKKTENIKITGYISEKEKNVLLKNCKMFLFPSVYEGFGMPVVEALSYGKKVVTTKQSAIKEVSMNKAVYVDNPYDMEEWKHKIQKTQEKSLNLNGKTQKMFRNEYGIKNITGKYLKVFKDIYSK